MPAVLEMHPAQLPPGARRKLTREACHALEAAGIIEPERYELIDGEVIPKMPKTQLHTVVLQLLVKWLRTVFGDEEVGQEAPIGLGAELDRINAPEPDAIVLKRPLVEFQPIAPQPRDLLSVLEVSLTTRDYDLGAKASLYAAAGIVEYWVLDLRDSRIVVHREPAGDRYLSIVAYAADEAVSPLAAPGASVRLIDLLRRRPS
jgi:Uma2 family endonuclease